MLIPNAGGPFCPKCTELTSDDPAFPLPAPVGNTCSLNPEIEQCDVGDRCETLEITTFFIRDAGKNVIPVTAHETSLPYLI